MLTCAISIVSIILYFILVLCDLFVYVLDTDSSNKEIQGLDFSQAEANRYKNRYNNKIPCKCQMQIFLSIIYPLYSTKLVRSVECPNNTFTSGRSMSYPNIDIINSIVMIIYT